MAFAIVGAVLNLGVGLHRVVESRRSETLPSDQSQTVISALRLAGSHGNPWATTTVTDAVAYEMAIAELRARPACEGLAAHLGLP